MLSQISMIKKPQAKRSTSLSGTSINETMAFVSKKQKLVLSFSDSDLLSFADELAVI